MHAYKPATPMHLKSYQFDGKLLRTGATNFSASGLKRQGNDLILINQECGSGGNCLGREI
jgi:hypothetical protein